MPTMGMGMSFFVVVGLVSAVMLYCYRKWKKRVSQRAQGLRSRRGGDDVQAFGSGGHRLQQRWMGNEHVPHYTSRIRALDDEAARYAVARVHGPRRAYQERGRAQEAERGDRTSQGSYDEEEPRQLQDDL